MEAAASNPSSKRIALVTGGNKGVGLETCRQLASKGLEVVLTARNAARGLEAVEDVRRSGADAVFHQLDVTDPNSVARLADFVRDQFGKLDILVNNAAVGGVEYGQEFDTNEEKHIGSEEVRQELNDVDNLTEGRLDDLLEKFIKDFKAGELEMHGWSTKFSAYKVAKAAMNAYSRILARRHPELRVNCAHPGFVKTDMSMGSGVLTPEEGARNLVKVALLPDGGPTGAYFAMGEEAPFV
ncbi:Short-chain dehydrogenase/reductase 2 [Triticum urartu]|uniref:Short-chain dehydrogenase/reductase 2 n=1 Tax=Triticum urartu TaxID=4572 RepID=M7YZK7_TRIUA|nr:Short-chain dehydrogenase/reductase 2 [Triticum urartu]